MSFLYWMVMTGLTRVGRIEDEGEVGEMIVPSFSIVPVSGRSGEIKGEAMPSLPNVPVRRAGEPPRSFNSGSQCGACYSGSDQVVWMVRKCYQFC